MAEGTAFTGQQSGIRFCTIIITCLEFPAKNRLGLTKARALVGWLVEGMEKGVVGEIREIREIGTELVTEETKKNEMRVFAIK